VRQHPRDADLGDGRRGTDADPQANAETDAEADAAADAPTNAEADPEARTEAKATPKPTAKPVARGDPEAHDRPNAGADANAVDDPASDPEPVDPVGHAVCVAITGGDRRRGWPVGSRAPAGAPTSGGGAPRFGPRGSPGPDGPLGPFLLLSILAAAVVAACGSGSTATATR
jgi:hypothetical protein